MPAELRESLFSEMALTRDRVPASHIETLQSQRACVDKLKGWSFRAASMHFALIVAQDSDDHFFAALVGGGPAGLARRRKLLGVSGRNAAHLALTIKRALPGCTVSGQSCFV